MRTCYFRAPAGLFVIRRTAGLQLGANSRRSPPRSWHRVCCDYFTIMTPTCGRLRRQSVVSGDTWNSSIGRAIPRIGMTRRKRHATDCPPASRVVGAIYDCASTGALQEALARFASICGASTAPFTFRCSAFLRSTREAWMMPSKGCAQQEHGALWAAYGAAD